MGARNLDEFAAFAARVRARATTITVPRGMARVPLSSIPAKDRDAWIDRWWSEGVDPTAEARLEEPTFVGWVQRAMVPGPGFEWARVELPRSLVETHAVPDPIGRKVRQDTREVMTGDIMAGLLSWDLGKRVRQP